MNRLQHWLQGCRRTIFVSGTRPASPESSATQVQNLFTRQGVAQYLATERRLLTQVALGLIVVGLVAWGLWAF